MMQGPNNHEGQGAAYVPMTSIGFIGGLGAGEAAAIFFDQNHNYLVDGIIGGFGGAFAMIGLTAFLIARANTRRDDIRSHLPRQIRRLPPRG